jgi:cytoplasmic iron level regulating protein YaaA (DUF328/UPF0246 family)
MLFLLSPSKALDYETAVPPALRRKATDPLFVEQAAELIALLRPKTPAQVASLLDLSDKLAQLNAARYGAWQPQATARNSKPAVLAFNGDVYDGLQAATLKTADLTWAQQHLVILSGLYGVLRPLDLMQAYRLEMGTRLDTPRGNDLHDFWGDRITQQLLPLLAGQRKPVLVNLASQEYFRAVNTRLLGCPVVQPVFQERRAAGYQVVSFSAKRARGLMARYATLGRVEQVEQLQRFDLEGYAFAPAASSADRYVFRRKTA